MLDLTGLVFERITVKGFSHKKQGHAYWNCVCSCGNEKVINSQRLNGGVTRSCGCIAREKARETCLGRAKHNMSKRSGRSRIYTSWANMKQRCLSSGRNDSKWYHEKGVSVCDKWLDFEGFLEDMGADYFDGASIERISNDDGYHKDNCKWIEFSSQARNKTDNRILTIDGVDMCMADAAEKYNINYNTLRSRIYKMGMDHKEAVTKPIRGVKK
tara:strand:- start:127 stop:768 length:642 start_codon:yes stop_codon:yes gene_type:complete